MSRSDRAKQFMPFAALRGFDDELCGVEMIPSEKKEVSEEDAMKISEEIAELKKGDVVYVEYYCSGYYIKTEGMISEINTELKFLTLIKTRIDFSEIYTIKRTNI